MKTLQGKVALVTGTSRGIGRAIALRFAAERTGEIAYSMAYPAAHNLTVYQLDGHTPLGS